MALKILENLWLAAYWYRKGIKTDVSEYTKKFSICQHNKNLALSPAGLLQPLSLPERVWEDLTIDFIEGLPTFEGQYNILVIVDQIRKYAHFIALCHPFIAQTVAQAFVKEVVRLHGILIPWSRTVSKFFLAPFGLKFFGLHATVLQRSTTYHPPTTGQS